MRRYTNIDLSSYTPYVLEQQTEKAQRRQYMLLRKAALERAKNLRKAGARSGDYQLRDLKYIAADPQSKIESAEQIRYKTARLARWLASKENTVRGYTGQREMRRRGLEEAGINMDSLTVEDVGELFRIYRDENLDRIYGSAEVIDLLNSLQDEEDYSGAYRNLRSALKKQKARKARKLRYEKSKKSAKAIRQAGGKGSPEARRASRKQAGQRRRR